LNFYPIFLIKTLALILKLSAQKQKTVRKHVILRLSALKIE